MDKPTIRITQIPSGEAPEWARKAWVGLVLPCDLFVGYGLKPEVGVLLLKNEGFRRNRRSYAVLQKDAISILANHSPSAAAWWRINGFPRDTPGKDYFSFAEEEAKVVSGVVVRQEPGAVYDNMETGRWEPWIYPKGFTGAR